MSLLQLMRAIEAGDVPQVNALCLNDPTIVNQVHTDRLTPYFDRSPLHYACEKGEMEIVRTLLEKGADINLQNCFGCTPLMLAASDGHIEVIRVLLHYQAHVNYPFDRKEIAITFAAQNSHFEVVRLLAMHGADVNRCFDRSPLHYACEKGEMETVRILLEKGADINLQNYFGHTPLMLADLADQELIIDYLLQQGASLVIKDPDEKTVIDYAIDYEQHERVRKYKYYINFPDASGNTLLHRAALTDLSFFKEAEEERLAEAVELLLKNGAEANAANNRGQIALHLAAKKQDTVVAGVMFHLLFHPADIEKFKLSADMFTSDDNNADMSIIFDIRKKCRQNAITRVSDVAHRDIEGNTPWMYVLGSGIWLSMKMFLAAGVDIHADDYNVANMPYMHGLLRLYEVTDPYETLEAARPYLLRGFIDALLGIHAQNAADLDEEDHNYIFMMYCIEANLFTPKDLAQEIRTRGASDSTAILSAIKYLSNLVSEEESYTELFNFLTITLPEGAVTYNPALIQFREHAQGTAQGTAQGRQFITPAITNLGEATSSTARPVLTLRPSGTSTEPPDAGIRPGSSFTNHR